MDLIAFNGLLYLTGQQVVDDLQMLKLAFLGAVPAAEADPLHGFADEANLLGNLRHKFIVVKANNKLVQEHIAFSVLSAYCATSTQKKTASEEDGLLTTTNITPKFTNCQS